ncbi:MAG: efflux RND transporter periplasmic adaptor subunit [Treponema sp.]|jgi:HlyD family secretion protein|nr:efflux RND transporter periplasmic adaptor subunit [Treponema sp.]
MKKNRRPLSGARLRLISAAVIAVPLAVFVIVFLALLAGGCGGGQSKQRTYEFTEIRRGNLERTVSSSGTINPVSTVKVLPRMSGKVEKIFVDFNDAVRKGDILAELNTDMLRLQREQQLAQVIKSRANYELQRINYRNQEALAEKNLISEYELKTSRTNLDIQAAELSAAEASLKVIETEINQYAFITSPIDGIVLERNITGGDTVVDSSSSNSSSIFTLAENLREMQIESWVGELDIAAIHKGQEVRFTLESLPGRNFSGVVESRRLMPSVQDNVVSYNVIISVDNRDGALLPGMSCAVEFIEEQVENALVVPNAALRYQPTSLSASEISDKIFNAGLRGMSGEDRSAALAARAAAQKNAADGNAARQGGGLAGLAGPFGMGGMRPPGGRRDADSAAGGSRTQTAPRPLWYIDESGRPDCILVRAGISDGINTEIRPLLLGGEGQRAGSADGERPRADSSGGGQAVNGAAGPPAQSSASGPEGMRIILRERI